MPEGQIPGIDGLLLRVATTARIDCLQPIVDIGDFLRTYSMRHRVIMPVNRIAEFLEDIG